MHNLVNFQVTKMAYPIFGIFEGRGLKGRIFSRVRPFYEQAVSDLDP